jgi:hypothetical protein
MVGSWRTPTAISPMPIIGMSIDGHCYGSPFAPFGEPGIGVCK